MDLIERQAAIDALDEIEYEVADGYGYQYEKWRKYFCELPPAQPEVANGTNVLNSDTISRQAAIDAVSRGCQEFRGIFAECEKNLNELPPAQPTYTDAEIQKMQDIEQAQIEKAFELGREDAKAEIIRCKDCQHWRQQTDHQGVPLPFGFCESDAMWDDHYCGYAERRTDEPNNQTD